MMSHSIFRGTWVALVLAMNLVAAHWVQSAEVDSSAHVQSAPASSDPVLPHVAPHRGWSFKELGLTPTLSGGRLKPFDSFARETVLFETGSRKFESWEPLDLLFSWIAFPTYWETRTWIKISRDDVKRQLGLDESRMTFSPDELLKNSILAQYAEQMERKEPGSMPPGAEKNNPREQELRNVLDKISLFHGLVTGRSWLLIPKVSAEGWGNLLEHAPDAVPIQKSFIQLLKAYQSGDQTEFEGVSKQLRQQVQSAAPGFDSSTQSKMEAEHLYQRFRPFLYAWVFYLIAAIAWVFSTVLKNSTSLKVSVVFGYTASVIAFVSHSVGFGLRCFIAGRPPVTNMYESVIWVSLGVMVFAWILYGIQRNKTLLSVASFLACFGLVAGDAAPAILDPSINPLVPVLRSNYWLTVHVLTITLGYAAFALTFGLANVALFQIARRAAKQKILAVNQLTYRSMQFGVVFIAAGTILGGVWADYSWGRFWGWDPKEVWALITLLCYLVILHGRYTNWMGPFGFAVGSAVSFMSVVMAWYGVNFILGAGLHSYGFSTGGTPWVLGFVVAELVYVAATALVHRRSTAE